MSERISKERRRELGEWARVEELAFGKHSMPTTPNADAILLIQDLDAREQENQRMLDAINWACGCGGYFGDFIVCPGSSPFWWRSQLTAFAGLEYNGERYKVAKREIAEPQQEETPAREQGEETEEEGDNESECARCHAFMSCEYPLEPTKYCHNCAHDLVAEYERESVAPPSPAARTLYPYDFDTQALLDLVQDTDYAKGHIAQKLHTMTGNERMGLYGAVVVMANQAENAALRSLVQEMRDLMLEALCAIEPEYNVSLRSDIQKATVNAYAALNAKESDAHS